MAAKKAAKKAVKKATKSTAKVKKVARRMVNGSDPFYVVVERGVFKATVDGLYSTRDAATARATYLEDQSAAPYNKFTVQRVLLAD